MYSSPVNSMFFSCKQMKAEPVHTKRHPERLKGVHYPTPDSPVYQLGDRLYTIIPYSLGMEEARNAFAISTLAYTIGEYDAATGRFLFNWYWSENNSEVLNQLHKLSAFMTEVDPFTIYKLRIEWMYV